MHLDQIFSELSLGLLAAGWLKTRFKKSTEEEELEEGAPSSPSLRLLPFPPSSEFGAAGGESLPVDGASALVLTSSGDADTEEEEEEELDEEYGASSTMSANMRSKYDTVSVASSSSFLSGRLLLRLFSSTTSAKGALLSSAGTAAVVPGASFRSASRCK